LGSRHRAAIGVTEENDSIAIVVSEETGRISLVEDGNVELGLDPERLREQLKALLRVRRSDMDRREAGYSFG
jgi:diadenylate cyclase